MHALSPAISEFLVHRASGKVEPWTVEPRTLFIGVCDPDHHGSRVGHNAEPLLAFSERLFHPLVFFNFGCDADPSRFPAGVGHRPATGQMPAVGPIGNPEKTEFYLKLLILRREALGLD